MGRLKVSVSTILRWNEFFRQRELLLKLLKARLRDLRSDGRSGG
jgi:hypothetical protein